MVSGEARACSALSTTRSSAAKPYLNQKETKQGGKLCCSFGMVWYGMVWVWYGMVWYGNRQYNYVLLQIILKKSSVFVGSKTWEN